jgi:DNA-binding MarR family transcriptional regulator
MTVTKDCLMKEIHQIGHMIKGQLRHGIREMGLKEVGHPYILKVLDEPHNKGQVDNQRDLAEVLRISPAAIAQSIKRMEQEGLLLKISDENDLRVNQITITDKGRAYVEQINHGLQVLAEQIFTDFTEQEIQQYHEYNTRIIENAKIFRADKEKLT